MPKCVSDPNYMLMSNPPDVRPLPFYQRPISLKTVLLLLLTPLVVVAVPALLWVAWNARPVNIESEFGVETPRVPVPNAHDLYEQAHRSFSQTGRRARAVAQVVDFQASQEAPEDPKKYPLAGKIAWLNEQKPALALFDRALRTEYLFPPVREPRPRGNIEGAYWLTWVARYVTVESQVLAQQGQSDKAVGRAMDIWKMSLDASRGTNITGALEVIKVEVWAHRALDGEIAHLNGQQAARAARRFEALLKTRVSYRDIIREERNSTLFQVKPLLEQSIHEERRMREVEAAVERGDYSFNVDTSDPPTLRGPIINWIQRRRSQEYSRGMQGLLANAEAPWSRWKTHLPTDLSLPVRKLIGVLDKFRFFYDRAGTRQQMTLARLALHAYRKDKGAYPTTLDSLVPAYLSKVPHDPFADGRGLRYRQHGRSYRLWSIGPDARDDNARPALNPSPRRPSARYLVTVDAAGDIVAGVSR